MESKINTQLAPALKEDLPTIGNYSFIVMVDRYKLQVTYNYCPFKSAKPVGLCHFQFVGITAGKSGFHSFFSFDDRVNDDVLDYAIQISNELYDQAIEANPKKFTDQLSLAF